MTTEAIAPAEEKFDLVAVFRAAAPETRDRKFWITLGVALLLHLAILVGIVRSPTRQMGDPNSAPDAVSVSFVTEAELRDATTGSDGGAAQPAQQPTPPPPEAQPQPPQPPTPLEAQAQPQPPPPAVQPAPKPAQPAEPSPAKPAPKAEALAKAEDTKAPETPMLRDTIPAEAAPEKTADEAERMKSEAEKETKESKEKAETKPETKETKEAQQELAELLKLPDPATLPQPTPKQPQAKRPQQQQKQAMRQPNMTMPPDAMQTPSYDGRSAGVQRPAGITRSGANDDFARGVIRALRQTMPQMNVLGRLTVRILINMNGNIQSVEVLSRSENSDLNRAVVFSTKQASFPFPPNGATELDRTFTITYIYH